MSQKDFDAVRQAIEKFGPRAQQFAEITKTDIEKYMAEIERLLAEDDAEGAGLAAHALKSIIRELQAEQLAQKVLAVELSGKDGNLDAAKEAYKDLESDLVALLDFVNTLSN